MPISNAGLPRSWAMASQDTARLGSRWASLGSCSTPAPTQPPPVLGMLKAPSAHQVCLPSPLRRLPSPPSTPLHLHSGGCRPHPPHPYISTQEAAVPTLHTPTSPLRRLPSPPSTPLHLHSGGCHPHPPHPWPPRTPQTFPDSGHITTPFMMLFLASGPLQSPDPDSPSVVLSRTPPLGFSPTCCRPGCQAEHLAGREHKPSVVSVSTQAPITRRPPVLGLGWKDIGERLLTAPLPLPQDRVRMFPVCLCVWGKGGEQGLPHFAISHRCDCSKAGHSVSPIPALRGRSFSRGWSTPSLESKPASDGSGIKWHEGCSPSPAPRPSEAWQLLLSWNLLRSPRCPIGG
ncbi:vegetative cell wall protein gp1-like [Homo sapiens]|uniref:vegetative cell wall protein gp1-like n=1 Tax=Homo sapiens TaxID=9606 RepID=UPI001FB07A4A|nr:vegetative cell wall protein gp1-like [Homo sapiens]